MDIRNLKTLTMVSGRGRCSFALSGHIEFVSAALSLHLVRKIRELSVNTHPLSYFPPVPLKTNVFAAIFSKDNAV